MGRGLTVTAAGWVQLRAMRSIYALLFLSLFLVSCSTLAEEAEAGPTLATITAAPTLTPAATLGWPTMTPTPLAPAEPATVAAITATTPPTPTQSAAATPTTADIFTGAIPPFRDDVALAVAYRGVDPALPTLEPEVDLQLGAVQSFFIGNVEDNTIVPVEAELQSIGDHAYYWFEVGDPGGPPDAALLAEETSAFDDIFDRLYDYYGVALPPGGRVHIVHMSPERLCGSAEHCGLAGYFSSRDMLPRAVSPTSNERAMFIMNSRQFGRDSYLSTLAHELRHLLGHDDSQGEEDWFVEGAAMLAEELTGFTDVPQARGSLFLQNTDQQLNSWTDEDTIPYYGQGYLLNRFLYQRLGAAGYRAMSLDPRPGLAAADGVTGANGQATTGEALWLDWLAAMALHDEANVSEAYRWDGPALEPISTTLAVNLPARFETTVHQYAADYYELPSSGTVTLDFAGAAGVSLVGSAAPSGGHYWYARRANSSNPRLTRAVDLRGVASATLQYQVYTDIERGYDFAYVSVSADGGHTWQGLAAGGMQGLDPADDPSGSALTQRFYTGRDRRWRADSVDLTPYAGQEIQLRFEYVTDLVLTYGGLAIDDVAIPEIGFVDDAETLEPGWLAEGFVRAPAEIPQRWNLQLITFEDGTPAVTTLELPEDGALTTTLTTRAGDRRPILVVAALSPQTLQPATYMLAVRAP